MSGADKSEQSFLSFFVKQKGKLSSIKLYDFMFLGQKSRHDSFPSVSPYFEVWKLFLPRQKAPSSARF
jgi:hypothetical protein